MELDKIKERIEKLTNELNYYSDRYYMDDSPEISDFEYDMLQRELKGLEEQYPQFVLPNSPNNRVGGGVAERLFS
jgi:DNA ligase (NAD+)